MLSKQVSNHNTYLHFSISEEFEVFAIIPASIHFVEFVGEI
jgi:hypothetical protein